MTNVIELSERLKERLPKAMSFGPAEIVIFPGVRIERLEEAQAQHKKSRRIPALQNQATAEELV